MELGEYRMCGSMLSMSTKVLVENMTSLVYCNPLFVTSCVVVFFKEYCNLKHATHILAYIGVSAIYYNFVCELYINSIYSHKNIYLCEHTINTFT